MSKYHVKVVKGRSESVYPADGYTVTTVPKEGYYAENPEVLGIPHGQKVKLTLEPSQKEILLPRDGRVAYITDPEHHGNTIDSYPKRREREMRVLDEEKREKETKKENINVST